MSFTVPVNPGNLKTKSKYQISAWLHSDPLYYYDSIMIVYFSLRFIVKYFNVIVLLESSNILCNHLCTLTTSTSSWSWPSNGSMKGEISYYFYYYGLVYDILEMSFRDSVDTLCLFKKLYYYSNTVKINWSVNSVVYQTTWHSKQSLR
jgi:hypothetical protein